MYPSRHRNLIRYVLCTTQIYLSAIADKDADDKEESKEDLKAENEQLREQMRVKDEHIKFLEQKVKALEAVTGHSSAVQ